jgi:two-component system, sensor histidine kinase
MYPKKSLQVEVYDRGIGISKKDKSKIFQPFSKVGSSTVHRRGSRSTLNRSSAGIGLGLSISKRIIEELGGEITVDSTLHKGSVFKFKIPCESKDPISRLKELFKQDN